MKKANGKHSSKNNSKVRDILFSIFFILLVASIAYLIYYFYQQWSNKSFMDSLADNINEAITNVEQEKSDEAEQELLEKLQDLKKENSDLVGWIKISDTDINYPVVQTTDNDYYINHNFKKEYNELGSIFLDKDCSITKPTANYLIYGHRSNGGQMFETLTRYKDEEFYKDHTNFQFATLDDVSEYKIIAVFQSQVYYKNQDVFKYYFFKDASTEEEFDNYVTNIKELSMYNIEETANFGDQLITLSTCDYHVEDGRFVVVAKKV